MEHVHSGLGDWLNNQPQRQLCCSSHPVQQLLPAMHIGLQYVVVVDKVHVLVHTQIGNTLECGGRNTHTRDTDPTGHARDKLEVVEGSGSILNGSLSF